MMIDVFCIGHPHMAGDSFGPRLGTMLVDKGVDVNVIGTMDSPIISSTLEEMMRRVRPGAEVIAVDACIGAEIGNYSISRIPINPGKAMRKDHAPIGTYSMRIYAGYTLHELIKVTTQEVESLSPWLYYKLMDLINKIKNKEIYNIT